MTLEVTPDQAERLDLARSIGNLSLVLRNQLDREVAATDGALGYFQHRFDVYDREGEPCKRCGAPVRRIVQSGRSTFYCPSCQR